MEIEKLGELSCLKVDIENKESLQKNIASIVLMMKEIESIKPKELDSDLVLVERKLREDVVEQDLLVNKDDCQSIHLEDGLFLAPKTVKK